MSRGKRYSDEIKVEARRLRRAGWSLNEISARLGPPKNTLTLWVRDIELTPAQQARLKEKERTAALKTIGRKDIPGTLSHKNHQAKLERLRQARQAAKATLVAVPLTQRHTFNHVMAAMLYLAEGSKNNNDTCVFANSNPQIILFWLDLLRSSFDIHEQKFSLRIYCRADQPISELEHYWSELTGITRLQKTGVDPRTEGKPTRRADYQGVCTVVYSDVQLQRYLLRLAYRLIEAEIPQELA